MFQNLFKSKKETKPAVDWFSSTKKFTVNSWLSFEYPMNFVQANQHDIHDNSIVYQFEAEDKESAPVIKVTESPLEGKEYSEDMEKIKFRNNFHLEPVIMKVGSLNFLTATKEEGTQIKHLIIMGNQGHRALIRIVYSKDQNNEASTSFVQNFLSRVKIA